MNIKLGILISFCLIGLNIFSQEQTEDVSESSFGTYTKVDFGLSGLSISLETPFSEKIMMEFAAGLGAGYQVNEKFRYRLYFEDPAFFATAHGKVYYKQKKTIRGGKNVLFNSGNFFGAKVKYTTPTLRHEEMWHTLMVGGHWGLQRNIGKYFLYQINLGIGAAIDIDSKTTTHMTLFPDANVRISYVLPFY